MHAFAVLPYAGADVDGEGTSHDTMINGSADN